MRITHPVAASGAVTVSIGAATTYPGSSTFDPDALVEKTDQALYQAKLGGRNRVHAADEGMMSLYNAIEAVGSATALFNTREREAL